MKHCISFLVIINLTISALCQTAFPTTVISKQIIDSAAISNWADLNGSEPYITPDGRYFMYAIENMPTGSKTLVIQSTENEWGKKFVGADKGFFSGDSKQAVFKNGDSLYMQSLGKDKILYVGNVASYKKPTDGTGEWLAYLTKAGELTLHNLLTDKRQQYQNVSDYQFDNNGRVLLLKTKVKTESVTSENLEWLTLPTNKRYTIWQSANDKERSSSNFSFDKAGKQVAFIVQDKIKSEPANAVWYYKEESSKAIEKATNETIGIDTGMMISVSMPTFSNNSKYIFFKTQQKSKVSLKPNHDAVQVDVWNYKDLVRQNIQLYSLKDPNAHSMEPTKQLVLAIGIDEKQAFCLQKSGGKSFVFTDSPTDIVIAGYQTFTGDKNWLREPTNYYLVSLKDGKSKLLASGNCSVFSFSNDGNYLVYFDSEKGEILSYELKTEKVINVSYKIPEPITTIADKGSKYKTSLVGFAGWLGDRDIIVYDNYDIWKIDVTGKRAPANLTNGYGKSCHIKFGILKDENSSEGGRFSENTSFVLSAFNIQNKTNGFFILNPKEKNSLRELLMTPHLYVTTGNQTHWSLPGIKPVKAMKNNLWIIQRQTANEAPNFFLTKNFKDFKQLTNFQPQKSFNWLTSEIISWQRFDGDSSKGILYKPENFNPIKKYPVLICYYEKRSDRLNEFLRPDFTGTEINIPWFVSRGYLVFIPDINYTIQKTSESIVNSVLSGVTALCKLKYVDSTRLGLQGQSFGGYETNCLITHSNKFAAAVESAGISDLISSYGSLLPDGSLNEGYKNINFDADGQYRLQATLWENRDAYIINSPIFFADKVTTPLLIRHNKKDDSVPWGQGVEFFIALRRLNKKVWMLQYDMGGHGVRLKKDKIDYTIRILQFFDHYLKEAPPPIWMTEGIPARLKGIEKGYELDSSGECGTDCSICKKLHSK